MKRFILLSVIVILIAGSFAFSVAQNFTLKAGKLKAGKAKMAPDNWRISSFKSAFGEPDRANGSGMVNTLHTYDEKGFVIYEQGGDDPTGKVLEIQVYFKPDKGFEKGPSRPFNGTFKMEKLKFSSTTTMEDVRKALDSKYHFEESLLGDSERGEYKGLYIYVHYNPGTGRIEHVSFGPASK